MAKDTAKKPLPNPADVPSVAPIVEEVATAKARLQKVRAAGSTDDGATVGRVRDARKRVKRAQRRLRRELRRAVVLPPAPAADAAAAAPAEADAG